MNTLITRAACTLALLLTCASPVLADTAVWKAEKAGSVVYLGGTIHLLRATDFPLPEEFDQAYAASQRLFFETDIGAINSPEAQARMAQMMLAEPGKTLQSQLTPATYQAYAEALQQRGLDIRMVEPFKVAMGVLTLQVAEFMRLGLSLEGVDMLYYQRAIKDQRAVGALESMEDQFAFMAAIGAGWEEEFVKLSLRDLDKTAELLDDMTAAWRSGDLAKLNLLFIDEMKRDYPDAYDSLMVQRNRNWLPQIERLFREPGTEFVLVGAAHMAGEDGLVQELKKRGYTVSRL
jgi:uncharacterized protein